MGTSCPKLLPLCQRLSGMLEELGTTCPRRLPVRQRLSGKLEEFVVFVLTQSISVCFLLPLGSSTVIWPWVDTPLGKAGGTDILLCPRCTRVQACPPGQVVAPSLPVPPLGLDLPTDPQGASLRV